MHISCYLSLDERFTNTGQGVIVVSYFDLKGDRTDIPYDALRAAKARRAERGKRNLRV